MRRQPAAGDLRMIFAIMKTVTDLERIGDEAQKIARMAKNIHERGGPQAPPVVEVRHAAEARDLDAAPHARLLRAPGLRRARPR